MPVSRRASADMALLSGLTRFDTPPEVFGRKTRLRYPVSGDFDAWAELRAASRAFLTPWEPTWPHDDLTRPAFRRRLRRYARDAGPLLGDLNELVRCDCTTRHPEKVRGLQRRMDELEGRLVENGLPSGDRMSKVGDRPVCVPTQQDDQWGCRLCRFKEQSEAPRHPDRPSFA